MSESYKLPADTRNTKQNTIAIAIRYHVSNYHSNCEILDPRLHAPNRAAGGYSHSERQALTALSAQLSFVTAVKVSTASNGSSSSPLKYIL